MDQTQGFDAGLDRKQPVFEGNVHAEHAGEHPRHLQGIRLSRDRAGELDRELQACVFQNVGGKVNNLGVTFLSNEAFRVRP